MRVRAIKDLNQLSDSDLFKEVSQGLEFTLENANSIISDAHVLLEQDRHHSTWILRRIAEEEAAKFLTLMDAVRCPRKPNERFTKHLMKFIDHLARGIYAEYYDWRLATFGEGVEYIEFMRKQYYLDGPEGVEWIFRNRILQEREEITYVDYIENDEGHKWVRPNIVKIYRSELKRGVLMVPRALQAVGCTKPESLSLIADIWRQIEMTEDFHFQDLRKINEQTLDAMSDKGLLVAQTQEIYNRVINEWLFPLYDIELKEIPISREELREIQKKWSPDHDYLY